MGAWGLGPFDSDGALDYLGDLAHQHATVSEDDFRIDPASVNHPAVTAALTSTLTGTTPTTPSWECADAYAAAGLVAAALTNPDADNGGGTRLLAGIAGESTESLGLGSHCGYTALLSVDDARSLVPAALAAVDALAANADWISSWYGDIDAVVEQLRATLRAVDTVGA